MIQIKDPPNQNYPQSPLTVDLAIQAITKFGVPNPGGTDKLLGREGLAGQSP